MKRHIVKDGSRRVRYLGMTAAIPQVPHGYVRKLPTENICVGASFKEQKR